MKILKESLKLLRVKKNFKSFINELGEDITNNVVNILVNFTGYIGRAVEEELEKNNYYLTIFKQFNLPQEITYDLIMSEFPTFYLEKIFSELKNIYKNEPTKEEFLQELSHLENIKYKIWHMIFIKNGHLPGNEILNVLSAYATLFYAKLFIKKNGLNYLENEIENLQKKNLVVNVFSIVVESIIVRAINDKIEREKTSKMRNRKVYEDEEIEVYKVDDSRDACITLGKGTNWCVANTHTDSHYKYYSSMGDMYVFIFKKIKKVHEGIEGQEKALLTIKNKISEKRKLVMKNLKRSFHDYAEAIRKGKYKFDSMVGINYDAIVADNLADFIRDTKTVKTLTSFNFHNITNNLGEYLVKIYSNVIGNSLVPFPIYNAGEIYKLDLYNEMILKHISESFKNIFKKFLNEFFDINNVKSLVDPEIFDDIKTLKEATEKYPWLDRLLYLEFLPVFLFEFDDGETEKVLLRDLKLSFQSGLKYDIILKDSSNNDIEFLSVKSSERDQKFSELILRWKGLNKYLNVEDTNDIYVINKFLNENYHIKYPEYEVILNEKSRQYIVQTIDQIIYHLKFKFSKEVESRLNSLTINKDYFEKILKHFSNSFEVIYFLFSQSNSLYFPQLSFDNLFIENDILNYFSTLKFKMSVEKDIEDIDKIFIDNSIDYWKENNFFEIEEVEESKKIVYHYLISNLISDRDDTPSNSFSAVSLDRLKKKFFNGLIDYLISLKRRANE